MTPKINKQKNQVKKCLKQNNIDPLQEKSDFYLRKYYFYQAYLLRVAYRHINCFYIKILFNYGINRYSQPKCKENPSRT